MEKRTMRWGWIVTVAALATLGAWAQPARAQQKRLPNLGSAGNIGPKPPVGSGGCSVSAPSCADVAPLIIRSALGKSPLAQDLRELNEDGRRVMGSAAEERAVHQAVEAFRKIGVDEVHTETYTMPVRWSAGPARLTVLGPKAFPVRLASAGWSPATPAGGITATVVDAGTGTEADFRRVAQRARGALLLVHTKLAETREERGREYVQQGRVLRLAVKAGVRGVLWMEDQPHGIGSLLMASMSGKIGPLPEAVIARPDALRLARLLAAGQAVRARLVLANRVGGPFQAENVVAEIRGREDPNEFVMLAAPLDSWGHGRGAGSAAIVIDAARAILAAGVRPLRSIWLILFTGMKEGDMGSWAFVRAHRADLGNMDAAILFGPGDGRVTGYELDGRPGLEGRLRKALAPAAQFHANQDTDGATMLGNGFNFLLEGVPTLVANRSAGNGEAAFGKTGGAGIVALKREEALAALTAYGIADLPERLGPQETRAQVGELLERTGLETEMKAVGIWGPWERGERGQR